MIPTARFTLLLCFALIFPYCKTTKVTDAPKPMEQYNNVQEQPLISTLTIPVNIDLTDLVRTINNKLSGKALYEDYSYDDNGGDGFMFNAWKSRDITLQFVGQSLKYYVPLKLWMKKNIYVGEAEAEAELALAFRTDFQIQPDWSLKTTTIVEYHEWLSRPVLKTGMGNISIETIASLILNRSKKDLASTIDRIVSQQLSLKPAVQEAWTALQEPVLLSEEYKTWVKTTPRSISMTPLTTDWNSIRTKIAVECINDVSFGEKPSFRENAQLPNLQFIGEDQTPDEFQVRIATDVPFSEAERLAKNMMLGQVFESGKNKVKVDDLALWGNNDKIVVNTKLSGSFNGNIYFMGKPVFNAQKNQVEMSDFDFHIDTKNTLLRSASWIFQGTIRKKMRDAMTFPVEENVKMLQQEVQNTLNHYEIQPGVVLTGKVDSVSVQDTYLTPGSIRVNLYSKGRVQVDVKGL